MPICIAKIGNRAQCVNSAARDARHCFSGGVAPLFVFMADTKRPHCRITVRIADKDVAANSVSMHTKMATAAAGDLWMGGEREGLVSVGGVPIGRVVQ